MVELGAKDIQNEDDIMSSERPLPGRYHFVLKDVDESFEKVDRICFDFEVLNGTMPNQIGRVLDTKIGVDGKEKQRLQKLAVVLGLLALGEEEKEINFLDAVGRQFVGEVVPNEYTNNTGKKVKTTQLAWLDFWSLGNKEVEDVPKDADAMKLAGSAMTTTIEAPATEAKNESGGDKPKDKWADL